MKLFKTIIVAGILGAFAVLVSALVGKFAVARAAADCTLSTADVGQIAAVQSDSSLSSLDEVKAELAIRKQLITKVITCGKGDADALRATLEKTPATGDTATMKAQLLTKFDDAENFYDIELAKLDGVGIAGSQAIAKELLAWRVSSYIPLSGEVNNFILWGSNQNLFTTATTRMNETNRAVAFLESVSNNADLESALADAQTSFANAQAKNAEAKAALAEFLPPDQSLAAVKDSLAALSDTYQKFSRVSDLIKAILPQ